ncbi:MAG: sigma-70 family RNA polymerase sigma factor [Merismopedia sp. SIO2A8]|nr:sigma-70 family RNA polymerase sigma factor [Merismopedia sp. SIO2A8]
MTDLTRKYQLPQPSITLSMGQVSMANLNQTLQNLIAEVQTFPANSLRYQQHLNTIYRLVVRSRKLWRESVPYYGDAVQQMWEYCCQHWDEYDPAVGTVTGWMNFRLKKELRRFRDYSNRWAERTAYTITTDKGDTFHPVDNLPVVSTVDVALEIWETTLHWVKTDPDRVLRSTYFRTYPNANAQWLFLKRFPSSAL